jgi:hypothetical protein
MDYMRARERMIAKLALGWGILGGMRLVSGGAKNVQFLIQPDAEPPFPPADLGPIFPNPQVIAGARLQLTAGAALDNMGRTLSLCFPRTLDLVELSKGLGAVQEQKTCAEWFGGDFCDQITLGNITGALFWVVAEYVETPTRPVPGLAGGGACDPEPSCDFSRKLESVRIRLVRDLPAAYFLHGCLEPPNLPGLEAFIQFVFDNNGDGEGGGGGGGGDSVVPPVGGANDAMRDLFSCLGFKLIPNYYEYLNQIALDTCCAASAVVLGRVILATEVGPEVVTALGPSTYYTFIDDAFPYRRVVPNAANTHLIRREIIESVEICGELTSPPE